MEVNHGSLGVCMPCHRLSLLEEVPAHAPDILSRPFAGQG